MKNIMNKQFFLIFLSSLFVMRAQADITALEFSPATVYEGTQVTVIPTIASVPEGTVYVCWSVYSDADCMNEIDTMIFVNASMSAPNAVSFTAPAIEGTYYIKCSLHTGSRCNGLLNTDYVSPMTVTHESETPTGMSEVVGDGLQYTRARKEMIDGTLYIVRDNKIYDARGIRVE